MYTYYVMWFYVANYTTNNGHPWFHKIQADSVGEALDYIRKMYENEDFTEKAHFVVSTLPPSGYGPTGASFRTSR